MPWHVPTLSTPSARPALDGVLADLRARRGRGRPAEADIAYRMISRGLSLGEVDEIRRLLRQGDQETIERTIQWLELDPFSLYSGFMKQRLMRTLTTTKLSTRQAARLRRALLEVFTRGPRQEFRDACRLAARLETPEFRVALEDLRETADPGTAERVDRVLAGFCG